jgi:hypothetical protein
LEAQQKRSQQEEDKKKREEEESVKGSPLSKFMVTRYWSKPRSIKSKGCLHMRTKRN